jgi:hypothetical protein
MKHTYPVKIGKQVPDLVAEEFHFFLKNGNAEVDCEQGRFFYTLDYLESLQLICSG